MRTKLNIISLALLLGCISISYAQKPTTAKDTTVWVIKNRRIPIPVAASEILRKSITTIVQPDYEAYQNIPKNDKEWKALQKSYDEVTVNSAYQRASRLGVSIEKTLINGITVRYVSPKTIDNLFSNSIFFHIHGGGYVFGKGDAGVSEAIYPCALLKVPMISVDYRMPPSHPYPTALEDIIDAYKGVRKLYPNHNIIMGGSSNGGALSMAATLKMIEMNLQLPEALYLITPWSDLTKTGDSYYSNEGIDRILVTYDGVLEAMAKLYANGHSLKDPYLSPIYADLSDFPPTFLATGTRDLFLSNTIRVHRKLRDVGVETDLVVIEGMSHGDHYFVPDSPETKSIFRDLGNFLTKHLPKRLKTD